MLARPRYAGLMPDGESTAAWEPVLDRPTLGACLRDPRREGGRRSPTRPTRAAGCCPASRCAATCGAPLQLRPSKGRGRQEYDERVRVQPGGLPEGLPLRRRASTPTWAAASSPGWQQPAQPAGAGPGCSVTTAAEWAALTSGARRDGEAGAGLQRHRRAAVPADGPARLDRRAHGRAARAGTSGIAHRGLSSATPGPPASSGRRCRSTCAAPWSPRASACRCCPPQAAVPASGRRTCAWSGSVSGGASPGSRRRGSR